MARLFFALVVVFTLVIFPSRKCHTSALALKDNITASQIQNNSKEIPKSQSTVESTDPEDKEEETSQEWYQTCLQYSDNQTVEDTRNEHIKLLSQTLSKYFGARENVHPTRQPNSPATNSKSSSNRNKGIGKGKNGEMKKRIFFPNLVKREGNDKAVTIRFSLRSADLPSRLASVKFWAHSKCRGRVEKAVLAFQLVDKNRKKTKCGKTITGFYRINQHVFDNSLRSSDNHQGWVSFSITSQTKKVWRYVQRVCRNTGQKRLNLLIKTSKCMSLGVQKTANGRKWRPYVEIVSFDDLLRVARKSFPPLECSSDEQRCCLQKSLVAFSELGSWASRILMPRMFYANYCRGSCPDNPQSRHSYQSISRQCCVPTKTHVMSTIYRETNKKIYLKMLPNVIVQECGCSN